jgi:hypothetical protein
METNSGSGVILGTPLADTLNLSLCNPPSSGTGDDDVGIADGGNLESRVRVYPNPASDILNFYIPSGKNINKLRIYNLLGEQVLEESEVSKGVSVSHLFKGVYIARIYLNGDIQEFKFIVN